MSKKWHKSFSNDNHIQMNHWHIVKWNVDVIMSSYNVMYIFAYTYFKNHKINKYAYKTKKNCIFHFENVLLCIIKQKHKMLICFFIMNESWKHFTPDRIHGEGKKCKFILIHPVFTIAEDMKIIIFSFSIQDSQEVYLLFLYIIIFLYSKKWKIHFCVFIKMRASIFLDIM